MNWDATARKMGFADECDLLTNLYIKEGVSISDIAERMNTSFFTISRHLDNFDIPKRSRGGKNRRPTQFQKLFFSDQRVVLFSGCKNLHELLGVSSSLLYKYRKVVLP